MTDTTTTEGVLRVPEVAVRLGVDRMTIYRMIHDGELRAIRLGRLIRVPESALADLLAGRTGAAVSTPSADE